MPSQNDVITELRALIAATWPETAENGIYRSREFLSIPFERKAVQELPVAVLDVAARPSDAWGAAVRAEELLIRISLVVRDGTDADALTVDLEALRTALWPDDNTEALTAGQVLEWPAISDSMDEPLNRYFALTQKPFWAGVLSVRVLAAHVP